MSQNNNKDEYFFKYKSEKFRLIIRTDLLVFEMIFEFSKWNVIFRNDGTIFQCYHNIRMDLWMFEYQKNYSYGFLNIRISKKLFVSIFECSNIKKIIRIDFYYSNRNYSNRIIRMFIPPSRFHRGLNQIFEWWFLSVRDLIVEKCEENGDVR